MSKYKGFKKAELIELMEEKDKKISNLIDRIIEIRVNSSKQGIITRFFKKLF